MAKNKKEPNNFRKFIAIVLTIAFFAAAVIDLIWLYDYFYGVDNDTIISTHINKITDPTTGEDYSFIEMNYLSSDNGIGKELFELRFNFYTGINMQNVRSWGGQFINDQWYFYEIGNHLVYSAIDQIEFAEPMIVSIDPDNKPETDNNELYSVKLTGTYTKMIRQNVIEHTGNFISNIFNARWNELLDANSYLKPIEVNYTFQDFFNACKQTLTVTNKGYGDMILPFVELSEYFSVYKYNPQTTEFENLTQQAEYVNNYFAVRSSVNRYGAVYAGQSFYGMVANNNAYNEGGALQVITDYWKHSYAYNATAEDFTINNGFLEMKNSVINNLANFDLIDITLNIDNIAADGILSAAGVKINTLTIAGSAAKTFTIKSGAISSISNYKISGYIDLIEEV